MSYAEIKALCAGNPLIAEKMNLDNEVAKLRMLKAEHKSQHYRLEDNLLKHYPEQITSVTERIAGIEKDIATYASEKEKCTEVTMLDGDASVSTKFPGMTVSGVVYDEKEPAAKALLDACKGVKGKNADVPVGEYMGFKLSLQYESFGQQINLLIRGAMTYKIDLGTDALGNITRLNNSLDKLSERLDGAKTSFENLNKQVEAAKLELTNPFEQESELQEKETRLALLNADLNIDGDGGMDIMNDTDSRSGCDDNGSDEPDDYAYDFDEPEEDYRHQSERVPQAAIAKSRPSILDGLRSFDSAKHNGSQGKEKPIELGI